MISISSSLCLSRLDTLVLKNKDTGQCVHPYGGRPGEGVGLVYWKGCDNLDRLKLEFLKLGKKATDYPTILP